MIPVTLELQAFLAFRQHVFLDFSGLEQEKMFLITGNTGSGKTSLFDAICFALYGEVSGSQRSTDTLKCQMAGEEDECFVSFTFENQAKRYTIRRTPWQMKLRRTGTVTPEKASAQLTLPDGTVLSAVRDVNQKIEEILGLTGEQFKKIVMLPQGEFRRFLGDSSGGKQEILRRIFGTWTFEELTEQLKEEYQKLERKLEGNLIEQRSYLGQLNSMGNLELTAELEAEEPDIDRVWTLAHEQTQKGGEQAKALAEDMEQCNEALRKLDMDSARKKNQRFAQLEKAKEHRKQLEEQQTIYEEKKQKTQTLFICRELMPQYSLLKQTQKQLEQVQTQLNCQTQDFESAQSRWRQLTAQYEAVQQQQKQVPQLTKTQWQMEQQLEWFQKQDQLKQQEQDLQTRMTALEQYAKRAECLAQLEQLEQDRQSLVQGIEDTQKLIELMKQAQTALTQWKQAYDGFLAHQAAFLARELRPGEPCPVCGSKHHPVPAVSEGLAALTREELDRRSEVYDQLRKKVETLKEKTAAKASRFVDWNPPYEQAAAQLKTQLEPVEEQIRQRKQQLKELNLKPNQRADHMKPEEFAQRLEQLKAQSQAVQLRLEEANQQVYGLNRHVLEKEKEALGQKLEQQKQLFETLSQQTEKARTAKEELYVIMQQSDALRQQYRQQLEKYQSQWNQALESKQMAEKDFLEQKEHLAEYDPLTQWIRDYEQRRSEAVLLEQHLTQELAGQSPVDLALLEQQEQALRVQYQTLSLEYEKWIKAVSQNQNILEKLEQCQKQSRELMVQYQQLKPLYHTAAGHTGDRVSLERYVLGVYFDQVIASANIRLSQMTSGRYFLKRREVKEKGTAASGLELDVFDSNSGKFRHVNTLSGGESFKTALALALGLADIMTCRSGGVELNTLLIDEGFGTLDHDALESAVECLMQLRDSGKYIGVISHVAQLREKIPVKLEVVQGKDGSRAAFLPF